MTVTVFSAAAAPTVSTVANGSLPNTTRVSVVVTVNSVVPTSDPAVVIPEFALDVTQVLSGTVVGNTSSIIMFNFPEFIEIVSGASLTCNLREVQYGTVNVYLETP
jgi:hypothetical protein